MKRFKAVERAFVELDAYMLELVEARRRDIKEGQDVPADLIGSLVKTADEEEEAEKDPDDEQKWRFGSREILGNVFIFNRLCLFHLGTPDSPLTSSVTSSCRA